jgi:hypothetical protein
MLKSDRFYLSKFAVDPDIETQFENFIFSDVDEIEDLEEDFDFPLENQNENEEWMHW